MEDKKKIGMAVLGIALIVLGVILMLFGSGSKEKYEVIFDTQGGSSVPLALVEEGETVPRPADPTKEGYIFGGWYYNNELFDFNTKIIKNLTLVARWNEDKGTLTLQQTSLTLKIGEKQKLEVSSLPKGIELSFLNWSSSDDTIVKVDENGNIEALKEGTATIMVKVGDFIATCTVTVTKIEVESIAITGADSVAIDATIKLSITYTPQNATDKIVTWTSSDEKIATIDKNGTVKGIKEGTVTITATTPTGQEATKTIKVTPKPKPVEATGIKITGSSSVYVKETITLKATITPSNTTNKTVTWSSNNKAIATVDKNGKVKGVSDGIVTITAKTSNGKTATFKVTVQSKYIIKLSPIPTATGVFQYRASITKNGSKFTSDNYKYIIYNDQTYRLDTNTGNDTIPEPNIDRSLTKATIVLNDGVTKVTAIVQYG